jgi:ribosomal protein S18 acetylase RimI-like enzyme
MEKVQIVILPPEKWQAFKQIRLESVVMEPQAFGSSYLNVAQRPDSHWQERLIEAQAGEKSWLLFAQEGEQTIGMIGACCVDVNGAVEIISVYVKKEKRGHGVAAALLATILEELGKKAAIRKAELTVNAHQTAAVALYRHFGFRIVREKTGVLGDGNTYSGYLMEKELRVSL